MNTSNLTPASIEQLAIKYGTWNRHHSFCFTLSQLEAFAKAIQQPLLERIAELEDELKTWQKIGLKNTECEECKFQIEALQATNKKLLDAVGNLLEWDMSRQYIIPYKVRDPIIQAIADAEKGVEG